jgi:hypothetical protein
MRATVRIKRPIDPQRIRPIPHQFAALDRRLVFHQYFRRMSLEQIALYSFLACVSDAECLSFYSEARICRELGLSLNGLWDARDALISAGLLLYRRPIYPLLEFPLI